MPLETSSAYPKRLGAFGDPQKSFLSGPIHEPDSAGLVADSAEQFGLLFRDTQANQNFLFRLRRDQLCGLQDVINRMLSETLPDTDDPRLKIEK